MILLIPSMDISEGVCTDCIVGERGTEQYYMELSQNLIDLWGLLRWENTKTIHVNDLDSLNNENNNININSLIFAAHSIDIPIQLYSKFDTYQQCKLLLDNGIYRIVVGDLCVNDPGGIKKLISEYTSSRISFAVFANNWKVEINDGKIIMPVLDYVEHIRSLGGKRIIVNEKRWNSSDLGFDFDNLIKLSNLCELRTTLYDAAKTPQQLWDLDELKPCGVDSVIIGRPFFKNCFPCQKIWRMIEAKEKGLIKT